MELTFDAEQLELGRVARSLLERRSDEAAVRLMVTDGGSDEAVWRQLAGERRDRAPGAADPAPRSRPPT